MVEEDTGIPLDELRLFFEAERLWDDLTMTEAGVEKAAAEAPGKPAVVEVFRRQLGGMFHATSGRRDDEELPMQPVQHTQVTVVLPGRGELQLTVPVDVSGADLLQLVQQQAGTISS
eukprot:GHRQ01039021.1.p2 GENE.GHRQ01039021.1~~GHRQ01039021.1.p2  ORF type:complete len:117 (+),score=54.87 GHRQ01039021.1:3-353(+)